MLRNLYFLGFLATAFAASSDSELPTITSTILSSSSCDSSSVQLAPLSFVYSNVTSANFLVAPTSASSTLLDSSSSEDPSALDPTNSLSKHKSTIYEYQTVTTDDIYEVVQTVCDVYSNCHVTTDLEKFTSYTITVNGILTVVTEGIPYTTDSSDHVDTVPTTTDSDIITTLDKTITVTKTHCDNGCTTSTELEVLATYTTTVDGIEYIYTTYCPLSSEKAAKTTASETSNDNIVTETDIATTVVTITSCSDNKCSKVPVTTGVTTVTGVDTIYTTYCPLTGKTTDSETSTTYSKTSTKLSTIDVITNAIITETPGPSSTIISSVISQSSLATEILSILTYEGAASIIKSGLFSLAVSFALSFI